ncbi:MAG: hypothetical protein K2H09_08060 [Treponemataceae bacterium]|nr:hypothetical protein [Treponemataceae bacterium]
MEKSAFIFFDKAFCTAAVKRSGNRFQSGGNFRFMNRTPLFREKFQNCLFPFCRHIHLLTVAKKYILFQPRFLGFPFSARSDTKGAWNSFCRAGRRGKMRIGFSQPSSRRCSAAKLCGRGLSTAYGSN